MDFSLTTLFVVPASNSLPTSGSTTELTLNQFGVFGDDYVASTAGNIPNEPYIYLAQNEGIAGLGTKRSDKISKEKIIEWYKVTAESDILNQVTEVSAFKIQCGEQISLTLRAHSNYIDSAFNNGLTRSVTVQAPCCACGAEPCTDLDPEALVDQMIVKAKQDTLLNKFFTFQRFGSGVNSVLRITGNPLDVFGNPCDIAAYPHEFDRMWFRAFIYPGAETTQDFLTEDLCDKAGTVAVTQRASYLRGTSDEVKQLEKNFFSYQASYKHLFRNPGWNGQFSSKVVDGTFYDTYVVKFKEYDTQNTWTDRVPEDATVIIAFPTTEGSGFETVMTAYLGAPVDKSAVNRTTTTTTSTTSTSTTSTTVLQP